MDKPGKPYLHPYERKWFKYIFLNGKWIKYRKIQPLLNSTV